jgi:E3 ubiquitin-protein ligase UBR1
MLQNNHPSLTNKLDHLVQSSYMNSIAPPQPGPFQMPGIFPIEDVLAVTSPGHANAPQSMAMAELVGIYKRLCDTFRVNQLSTRYNYPTASTPALEDLTNTDTLAKTLGFSIAATEIAQRGIESAPGSTLLDKIPQQTLTHLRILSETTSSYIAIGGLRNGGANKTVSEFSETHIRQLHQLLIGHPQIFGSGPSFLEPDSLQPLLGQDPFIFLAECSVCIIPAFSIDVHHVLQLCYMAEIVKVALAFLYEPEGLLPFLSLGDCMENDIRSGDRGFTLTATGSLISFLFQILDSADVPMTAPSKKSPPPSLTDCGDS